ncbi:hypothetical protein [Salinarimonas rosea]|uniref:hypothetical protein n=1 Tax=Salinarimonas rosea TaxID=552063 RepID=UPI0004133F09|nr:hypothetical protein [Salinarimonas rosea]
MSKALAALRRTAFCTIQTESGPVEVTMRKLGTTRLLRDFIEDEASATFVEALVRAFQEGRFGKDSVADNAKVGMALLTDYAAASGAPPGRVLLETAGRVIAAIDSVIVRSTVAIAADGETTSLADPELSQAWADEVEAMDLGEKFACLSVVVALNFAAAYGPFVRLVAQIKATLEDVTAGLAGTSESGSEGASSEPAPTAA